MITDEAVLRDALIALEDVKTIAACLQGSLGPLAKNVSRSNAEQALHTSYVNAGEFVLRIGDQAVGHPLVDSLVSGEGVLSLTSYEKTLLRAAGSLLYEDVFFDEVLSLIRRTDDRIEQILKEWPPEHRKIVRGGLFADLYVFEKSGDELWPTSFITTACHNAFRSQAKTQVLSKVARLLDGSKTPTSGELYLCALLLRRHQDGLPINLPTLLRLSWGTGLYHLRLETLQLVQGYAHKVTGSLRDEIVEVLSGFETNNLFLNTQLVETSMAYDLMEPVIDATGASLEIDEIIRADDIQETREWAYAAITKQFEDVFQGAYFSAIRELSKEDLITLYTRGSLGAASYGFFCDYILEELIQLRDVRALPAFERWATEIDAESSNTRETARVYALAQAGCAIFRPFPAQLANLDSDAKRAWQLWGDLVLGK